MTAIWKKDLQRTEGNSFEDTCSIENNWLPVSESGVQIIKEIETISNIIQDNADYTVCDFENIRRKKQ